MRPTFLSLLFVVLTGGLGCKKHDTIDSANLSGLTRENELETRRMMENDLRMLYDSCEILLRADGVQDQHKIDVIMQLMIDGGDLASPYIFENGSDEPKFVTYIEYKTYRSKHPLDTTRVTHFQFQRRIPL